MTTYTVTFDLAEAQTGVSGHYPVLVRNSTYAPDNTIYAKSGDTVKFIVSEPSPDGASVSYNNTNVADTDPDPDEFTAGTTNQSSPSSWEYTLGSSAEDAEFYWFYFGTTVHSSGSGKKYSQRVRVNRVSGSPLMNGGTSAITVTQGGTITFSVSGLSGLLAPSGSHGNCLYFAIFNAASGGSLINPTSYTGGGWDSSSNQLGKVKTTDTSTVLTVGSNFPVGTYYVYLTHFNAADTPGGNDFYGSEQRLSTTALQFTVQESNTGTVSGLNLGADYNAGTALSAVLERNSGTITCSPSTFQPTSSVSNQHGAANAKQRLGGTTNNFSTANLVLSNGQSVDFQMTGPAAYSSHTIGRLTIAEDHDDLRIDTGADPGSGGGTGGATAGNYGLKVTNSDGDQLFGTGFKSNVVILTDTRPALAHNASETFTLPIAAADNTSSKVAIVVVDMFTTTSSTFINWPSWTITRSGNTFTVTNSSGNSRPYRYVAIRI